MTGSPLTGAQRQARRRARQARLALVVQIEVDLDITEALVAARRLDAERDGDREAIAASIEKLLRDVLDA